jgi:hypothetical protein
MKRRRSVAAIVLGFFTLAGTASAAVTSEFFVGTLTASSDAADPIAVACAGGDVRVNAGDPDTGPVLCAEVDSVEVSGGPGANTIDLHALAASAFPALVSVSAIGDEGDDTLVGGPLGDEFDGGEGDDTIRGNAGTDTLDGGEGSDRVLGGDDDDQLFAGIGIDMLDGQQGSDTYELDLTSNGGGRISDTGSSGIDVVTIVDCNDVDVGPTRISKGEARVTVSGVERYPCGYTLPPEYRPDACVVPALRGRVLVRARSLLGKAHCRVGKVKRVRSTKKKNVVVAQKPAAGKRLPKGGSVTLTVSKGPRR